VWAVTVISTTIPTLFYLHLLDGLQYLAQLKDQFKLMTYLLVSYCESRVVEIKVKVCMAVHGCCLVVSQCDMMQILTEIKDWK